MQILVVDDEVEIGMIVSMILRKKGHSCETANRLADAKVKLEDRTFDILFLDVNLPDGVGLDFIPVAKGIQPDLKIFVISAYDSGGEPKKAKSLGAHNFIKKPFSKSQIIEAVTELAE